MIQLKLTNQEAIALEQLLDLLGTSLPAEKVKAWSQKKELGQVLDKTRMELNALKEAQELPHIQQGYVP